MTSCAAFGRQPAIFARRHAYHSHTRSGLRRNASGVAKSSARYWFQRPSCPRNVGTPLAAETPAPVRMVRRDAAPIRAATASMRSCMLVELKRAVDCTNSFGGVLLRDDQGDIALRRSLRNGDDVDPSL